MKSEFKGIFLAVTAYFLYSLALLSIKLTPCSYILIAFSRSLIGLLLFSSIFIPKDPSLIRTVNRKKHFYRSIASISTIFCSTYGIQRLALVDAVLLENTLPFFTPLIMLIFYRKKITKIGLVAIAIGFIGVFFILQPKLEVMQFASLASLAAGFLAALSMVLVHDLSKTEKNTTILFYFLFFSTCFSALPIITNRIPMPSPLIMGHLILIGGLFLLFQSLITKAHTYISPNTLCGFSYLTVAFSVFWEKLVWSIPLDLTSLLGNLLILSAGFAILWERARLKKQEEQTT